MGMTGGAQPLAATMNGAAFLGIDVDPEQIKRCVKAGYCDVMVNDLDEALRILKNAVRKREAASVGLTGNCADVIPALARRGVVPDLFTDQTGANDLLGGYIPQGLSVVEAAQLRQQDPGSYRKRALDSIAMHVEGMLALQKLGSIAFEYGDGIRAAAFSQGVKNAYDIGDSFTEYIAPKLAEGFARVYCVAQSGQPADIRRIDALALEIFPHNDALARWITLVQKRIRFQGRPARVYWLSREQQTALRAGIGELVARDELKAAITVGLQLSNSAA